MPNGFQNVNNLPCNACQYGCVIVLLHFKKYFQKYTLHTIGALFAVSKSISGEPTTWRTLFESQRASVKLLFMIP